jgi:hypothetical protein
MDERIQFWSVPDRTVRSIIETARLESFMQAGREAGVVNLDSDEEEEAPGPPATPA